jgi:hypothetical protein
VEASESKSGPLWITACATAFGLAALIAAIYVPVALAAVTFRWTAIPMFVIYGLVVIGGLSLAGAVREWRFPGMRGPEPPVDEHGDQLRATAKDWADTFGALLKPDWAIHRVKPEQYDSDEGLIALRKHFPQLNVKYRSWKGWYTSLAKEPTNSIKKADVFGNEPMSQQGKDLLYSHNKAVREIVSDLNTIQGLKTVSGQCDQCARVVKPQNTGDAAQA